ncbi:MAG: NAD(P)H-dependent oxidoreductase [Rhizobiales bacterium]|nr:NAD(P)H-dependent oxidoreductase [Hyphomicrobiales bacterium]NRB13016.1 NAD(P)H-dependent oxidoreductase [Hyphomicrobiales bacterium]
MTKILHIDSSSNTTSSNSRKLSAAIVAKLGGDVTYRDLATSNLSVISEAHIAAFYTPKDDRNDAQNILLAQSDELVKELFEHDVIVIGVPMYNFNIPGSLKLYQDLVARVGETFVYTETGPKGLIEGKKIYFALTTGGVPIGSEMDYVSPSLKSYFGFLGLTDQTIIGADGLAVDPEVKLATAFSEIENLAA